MLKNAVYSISRSKISVVLSATLLLYSNTAIVQQHCYCTATLLSISEKVNANWWDFHTNALFSLCSRGTHPITLITQLWIHKQIKWGSVKVHQMLEYYQILSSSIGSKMFHVAKITWCTCIIYLCITRHPASSVHL